MSRKVVAGLLVAATIGMSVAGIVIAFRYGAGWSAVAGNLVSTGVPGLACAAVGLIVVARRRGGVVGWGFLLAGFFFNAQVAVGAYADAGLRPGGTALPGALAVGNVTQWIFVPAVYFGITLPFLVVPDGRLLSPRWRWVSVFSAVAVPLAIVGEMVAPGPLTNYPHLRNPLGLHSPVADLLLAVGFTSYCATLFAAVLSALLRYRRSEGTERLQMRWFALGVAGTGLVFAASLLLTFTRGDVGAAPAALIVLPVCTGIAILRYRLFEIDRVLSRTVTYLLVTGVLVGVYVGVIALTTSLLSFGSSLGVAASTLAAAALFQPVRRRVQRAVDRRFNRAQYDASRTVEQFAVRLRDEVDPDTVRRDLLTVTAVALQPTRASLWVSP